MIYSHYSEPGSRTGTRAPLENTAITAKAATSLRQPTRQWEFLPNLPSAELVRAHVGGYRGTSTRRLTGAHSWAQLGYDASAGVRHCLGSSPFALRAHRQYRELAI